METQWDIGSQWHYESLRTGWNPLGRMSHLECSTTIPSRTGRGLKSSTGAPEPANFGWWKELEKSRCSGCQSLSFRYQSHLFGELFKLYTSILDHKPSYSLSRCILTIWTRRDHLVLHLAVIYRNESLISKHWWSLMKIMDNHGLEPLP